MRVVVNDANILIDLIDANLLELFFKLKFEMNLSDSVVGEFEIEDEIAQYSSVSSAVIRVKAKAAKG